MQVEIKPKNTNRMLSKHTSAGIMDHLEAHALWLDVRAAEGLSHHGTPSDLPLLTGIGDNAKQSKQTEWLRDNAGINGQVGISLAPDATSRWLQNCTYSTPECRKGCLATAGNGGRYDSVTNARIARTRLLAEHPDAFMSLVWHELVRWRKNRGPIGFRPNVLSDVRWEQFAPHWFTIDGITCHDYTKDWGRTAPFNYHLTYSASERTTETQVRDKLAEGCNVAMVLAIRKADDMPAEWRGMPVIDGDVHDYRPIDPSGVIVALRPKGQLPIDSPFVFPPF